jgi:hypothetical protein
MDRLSRRISLSRVRVTVTAHRSSSSCCDVDCLISSVPLQTSVSPCHARRSSKESRKPMNRPACSPVARPGASLRQDPHLCALPKFQFHDLSTFLVGPTWTICLQKPWVPALFAKRGSHFTAKRMMQLPSSAHGYRSFYTIV